MTNEYRKKMVSKFVDEVLNSDEPHRRREALEFLLSYVGEEVDHAAGMVEEMKKEVEKSHYSPATAIAEQARILLLRTLGSIRQAIAATCTPDTEDEEKNPEE